MPFGVELDALVLEHRKDATNRVFPDLPLGFHLATEAAKFGDGTGFPGAEFDPSVGNQIETGNPFRDPLRWVGRELNDPVAKPDVFRALAGGAEKDLGRGRM